MSLLIANAQIIDALKYSNFSWGGLGDGNTITLKVSNSSGTDKEYKVFNENPTGKVFAPGVNITVPESSLEQVTRTSQDQSFKITGAKIVVSDQTQFTEPIYLIVQDIAGQRTQHVLQPANYESPAAGNPNIIEIPNLNMVVTGDVGVTGTIKAGVNMSILLYLQFLSDKKSSFAEVKKTIQFFPGFPVKLPEPSNS